MSWFKRNPRVKEPPKHLPHHRTSPMAEKLKEEAKKEVRAKKTKTKNP